MGDSFHILLNWSSNEGQLFIFIRIWTKKKHEVKGNQFFVTQRKWQLWSHTLSDHDKMARICEYRWILFFVNGTWFCLGHFLSIIATLVSSIFFGDDLYCDIWFIQQMHVRVMDSCMKSLQSLFSEPKLDCLIVQKYFSSPMCFWRWLLIFHNSVDAFYTI